MNRITSITAALTGLAAAFTAGLAVSETAHDAEVAALHTQITDTQASLDAQIDWSATVVTERDEWIAEAHRAWDETADVRATVETWHGFTVGEVIVCHDGAVPVNDTTPDGTAWAACQ